MKIFDRPPFRDFGIEQSMWCGWDLRIYCGELSPSQAIQGQKHPKKVPAQALERKEANRTGTSATYKNTHLACSLTPSLERKRTWQPGILQW